MPGFFSAKPEQHQHDGAGLRHAVLVLRGDLVDQAEDGLFDELDEAFEHLGLAREVAIERRFGDIEARGKRGRGDLLALGGLEHGGEGLQDLHTALTRFGTGCLHRRGRGLQRIGDAVPGAGRRIFLLHRLVVIGRDLIVGRHGPWPRSQGEPVTRAEIVL